MSPLAALWCVVTLAGQVPQQLPSQPGGRVAGIVVAGWIVLVGFLAFLIGGLYLGIDAYRRLGPRRHQRRRHSRAAESR